MAEERAVAVDMDLETKTPSNPRASDPDGAGEELNGAEKLDVNEGAGEKRGREDGPGDEGDEGEDPKRAKVEVSVEDEGPEKVEMSVEDEGPEKVEEKEAGEGEELIKEEEDEGKEEPTRASLGPKEFNSSVEMFDYFFKLLHAWSPHLDINKYEYLVLMDLLKKGHAEPDKKVGVGIEAFEVRYHPLWKSRCFFLRRVDGTSDDFSFRKCVDKIIPLPDNMKINDGKAPDGKKTGGHQKGGGGHGGRGGGRGGGRRGRGRGRR